MKLEKPLKNKPKVHIILAKNQIAYSSVYVSPSPMLQCKALLIFLVVV